MYDFDGLMKENQITTARIMKETGLSGATVKRIRDKHKCNKISVQKMCDFFGLKFVPEEWGYKAERVRKRNKPIMKYHTISDISGKFKEGEFVKVHYKDESIPFNIKNRNIPPIKAKIIKKYPNYALIEIKPKNSSITLKKGYLYTDIQKIR